MAEISLEGGLGLAPVKTDQRRDEEEEVQEGSTLEGGPEVPLLGVSEKFILKPQEDESQSKDAPLLVGQSAKGKSSPEEDIVWVQVFHLTDHNREEEANESLKTDFCDCMLNELNVVFWKAALYRTYADEHRDKVIFTLHLHLFGLECLTEEVKKQIRMERVKFESQFSGTLTCISTGLVFERGTSFRKPVFKKPVSQPPEGTDIGSSKPPPDTRNCLLKFLDYWLIVPRVQWDFFDLLYQMYTFDIAHQGFIPKFVHFFTIPSIVILFFVFMAQFPFQPSLMDGIIHVNEFVFDLNYGAVALIILMAAYIVMGFLRKSPLWGCTTAFCLVLCYIVGNALYDQWRYDAPYLDDMRYNGTRRPWYDPVRTPYHPILWSYVLAAVQASSHFFVPQLPPFITGLRHWEGVWVFLLNPDNKEELKGPKICLYRILSIVLFPVLCVSVAYFSWPHLIGTEVFYIMAGVGYRHDFFEKYRLVATKAELSGDPKLSKFPTSVEELTQNPPQWLIDRMHNAKLITKDKAKPTNIARELAALHIYRQYFFRRDHVRTNEDTYKRFAHLNKMLEDTHRFSNWRKERTGDNGKTYFPL